ncbi:MAG: peptidyl-tRNA hydrolase Pth2 [Candidatus Hadarchaeum sp.]|uniref:peptidyl-tRNA hydrolase Pth2 n=1 Tax=Candidatus Hadarchaeum sp. TaxID=2883567 RepID=UPI00317D0CFC
MFKYKQVIVVRIDIEMSPGKLAAQVAHGSVGAAEETRKKHRGWFHNWFSEGQKKVVVKVGGESELRELKKKADKLGLPNMLVVDAGLTELAPGTVTALGIGPAPNEILDQITGNLPLL